MQFQRATYWVQVKRDNVMDVALRRGWINDDVSLGIHEMKNKKWAVVDLQSGIRLRTSDSKLGAIIEADKRNWEFEQFQTTPEYARMVNTFRQKVNEKR
jgi:hypothetical protein